MCSRQHWTTAFQVCVFGWKRVVAKGFSPRHVGRAAAATAAALTRKITRWGKEREEEEGTGEGMQLNEGSGSLNKASLRCASP